MHDILTLADIPGAIALVVTLAMFGFIGELIWNFWKHGRGFPASEATLFRPSVPEVEYRPSWQGPPLASVASPSAAPSQRQARPRAPLDVLRELEPFEFERFVGDVFAGLSYQVERTRLSHDQGVDAILSRDGITFVVQAKRFAESQRVGAPTVRDFWGALDDFGAAVGFFVTTSSFTPAARMLVDKRNGRLRLIDGTELVNLAATVGVLERWNAGRSHEQLALS